MNEKPSPRKTLMTSAALAAIVFLSGWAGLAYEVLWARYLSLTLGGTAAAHAFVLAAFLGGLAAGYAWLGHRADASPDPLRFYAALELGIAALGALAPLALASAWGMPVVVVSAMLMGGTLPALTRHLAAHGEAVGKAVSWLYYLNSLGAAVGAASAALLLVPRMGLDGASAAAVVVNLAVSAGAWTLSRFQGTRGAALSLGQDLAQQPLSPQRDPKSGIPAASSRLRFILMAVFVSGVASLCCETAFIRILSLVMGSTVHSFAVMLAGFIAGIATGALIVALWRPAPATAIRALGWTQFGAAAGIAAGLPLAQRIPFLYTLLARDLPHTPQFFLLHEAFQFAFAFCLMLPLALFIGMSLPLATLAADPKPEGAGSRVGAVFAFNAAGNILGAVAAGLWLLPTLGLARLFAAAAAANIAVGLFLLGVGGAPRRAVALASCLAAIAALSLGLTRAWDARYFVLRSQPIPLAHGEGYAEYSRFFDGKDVRLVFYRDDAEATVAVIEENGQFFLTINGKTDASTSLDMHTQALLAHIPLLNHRSPKKVLVVGLGSGMTVASALTHPVEKVTVVEISSAVITADSFFAPFNSRALASPRVELLHADARMVLMNTKQRYDVIISEPSNPWIAGMANLFTLEFYQAAAQRLNEGGMFCQWFHIYQMDDETLRMVLRTFAAAFPHVSIWHTYFPQDIILLGSVAATGKDYPHQEAAFALPQVRADLKRLGIGRLTTFLSLQAATDATVRTWAGTGPLHRDRFPRLEYAASRGRFLESNAMLVSREDDALDPQRRRGLDLALYLSKRGRPLDDAEHRDIQSYYGEERPGIRRMLAREWRQRSPASVEAILAGAHAALNLELQEERQALLAEANRRSPGDPRVGKVIQVSLRTFKSTTGLRIGTRLALTMGGKQVQGTVNAIGSDEVTVTLDPR